MEHDTTSGPPLFWWPVFYGKYPDSDEACSPKNTDKEESNKMTKAELAVILHEKTGIARKDAIAHVDALLDLIKSTLESGENVKITGFGVFEVKDKHARRGRNPHTGEAITIDARKVLTFSPSAVLRQAINT
jgi:integration host factor subunit alpha